MQHFDLKSLDPALQAELAHYEELLKERSAVGDARTVLKYILRAIGVIRYEVPDMENARDLAKRIEAAASKPLKDAREEIAKREKIA